MKKIAVLCTVCVILSVTFLPVYAMGMTGTGSAGEMLPSGDSFYDAGNNARTGDIENNGGTWDGSAGGTAQGTVGGTETTRNPAESGNSDDNPAGSHASRSADEGASMTTGESAAASGSGWFAVILSIIVVAAIIALIVALLPKRNRV